MEEFVPFDASKHLNEFRQMNIETTTWHFEQLRENYEVDAESIMGQTAQEYVDDHLDDLKRLRPPEGIIYMLLVEGDVAGMGAVVKLRDEVGEIRRMWNRPKYRGRGYGRQMLNRLFEAGGEFGFSKIMLSTPRFAHAAQHIYRSAGFQEREEYPETEIPLDFRSYWIYMEKNAN